ncbi:MAG: DUF1963 domain-containing protein [Acidobacteriota bacterium]
MSPKEIRDAFEPWRQAHARPAWKLLSEPGATSRSWFGGLPLAVDDDDSWPICESCGLPMRLMLQLDLAELPEDFDAIRRDGVLQVFYCSLDDGSCDTWAPFSGTHHLRIVEPSDVEANPPSDIEIWPKVPITGWRRFDDAPDPEEHERLGIEYTYDFNQDVVHVRSLEPAIELRDVSLDLDPEVEHVISRAARGDKLGGWPHWIQGPEYPVCPISGEPMELLVQIDSEDHLDYMFGDSGCAHITQSRQHPEILALGWACS